MDILEKVEDTLSPLGVPMAAGSMLEDPLPDTFIVYNDRSEPEQHADDDEILRFYYIEVSLFSKSGPSSMPDVDGAMKAGGFKKGNERMETYSNYDGYFHFSKDFTYIGQV